MEDYTVYTETYFLSSDRTHVKVFEQVSKVQPRHKYVKCHKNIGNSITLKGNIQNIKSFIYELSIRGVVGVLHCDS
jgi:hypothetical protein